MWSDKPVHREFTARPSHLPAEANHRHIHNPAAVAPVPNTAPRNNGKSRPERACDLCRRRKTKCDGSSAPDNACSNCVQNNQSCTYLCAYMHVPLSLHVTHLPPAKSLAREVHQKRSSQNSHSPLFSRFMAYTPLVQLCLWPRRPPGEDGSTAQESAYPTNLLATTPSEPEYPLPSCALRSISPNISVRPSSGIPGSWMHNSRARLLGHLARETAS